MLALASGALVCLGLLSPVAGPRSCGLAGHGACNQGTSAAATADDEPRFTVQSPLVAALKAIVKAQDAVQHGDNQTALSSLAEAKTLIELQINSPTSPGPTDDANPAVPAPADSRFMVIIMPDPRQDRDATNGTN
jgi:hypothetical protein